MGKLHELLAVETHLQVEAQRVMQATQSLFTDGQARLEGLHRTYTPTDEHGDILPGEHTELATTVEAELAQVRASFGKWLDASFQKETTNTGTAANVEIDGNTLLEDVPAPALLNLEAKLAALRKVYEAIPVTDPSIRWTLNTDVGGYVSPEQSRFVTQKVQEPLVLYPATPEHPAQTQLVVRDVRVGTWHITTYSGKVSATVKREWLARIDNLLEAVKRARQRANDIEHVTDVAAETLFAYIHS